MFNKLKIAPKLLLVFFSIGLLSALLTGFSALWYSRAALSGQALNQLESMREVKKVQVEDFIAERKSDMQILLHTVANLRQNAWQKLQSAQENKLAQIRDYFQSRQNDLAILSRAETVAHAIEQFSEALELDGGEAGIAWESIKGMLDEEFQHYKNTLGYEDLLLIDQHGVVVYSTLAGEDLGEHIGEGALKDTPLGQGFRRALEERRVVLQDFAPYPAAAQRQVMFILGAVWRFDKQVGVLAFRLGPSALDEIVQRRKGMGNTGESYLVGGAADAAGYRSTRKPPNEATSLPVGSPASGEDVRRALQGEAGMLLEYSERDKLLLTAYAPLEIPSDLPWALITSMEVEEALTPRLAGETLDFFGKYLEEYGFHDLLLVHPQGKVFYSVKHEAEYNTDLLRGEYAGTELGKAVKTALDSGGFAISDYAPYAPSGDAPSAFVAQPLLDAEGKAELVVAVQLTDAALNRIMRQRAGMGASGETYLVGGDNLLRSNTYLAPETYSIKASFADPAARKIQTHGVTLALGGESGRMEGRNYLGHDVLSAYMPIRVGNQTWALVAEINRDEALAAIEHLQILIGAVSLGIILLVWFVSRGFTRRLVTPLVQVNEHLKVLAAGELSNETITYRGADEIAELVDSAHRLKAGMESTIAQADAVAAGDYSREVQLLSQRDRLGLALSDMTRILRDMRDNNAAQDWLKSGLAQLDEKMRGTQDIATLAKNVIDFLAHYLDAQVGLFYVYKDGNAAPGALKLIASYAYVRRKGLSDEFAVGEGLVGQAALERKMIVVDEVPEDYVHVQSGAGNAAPRSMSMLPVLYENQLQAVLELGTFRPFGDLQLDFLKQAAPAIGIGVYTAESRTRLEELLQQSQAQSEELQSQSEELQVQQEELRQSNEELEERTRELERQKDAIRAKNTELERAKGVVEQKARELELANKYKSEFLANMSHELRTPLNSLLILAQMLANNKDGNLTAKQVEHAKTIHHAGGDLLNLINEILDLSKIEAGKIELHAEEVDLRDVLASMERRFRHMAEDKGLQFAINCDEGLPATFYNETQRLQQVLTNLLSNAFKFTPQGGQVTLSAARPSAADQVERFGLDPGSALVFRVSDTGIGIPPEKHALVFEAFQQADGSTARKYGGTGLGLSICRQLVQLMGGTLQLASAPGQGSTFSVYVPQHIGGEVAAPLKAAAPARPPAPVAAATVQAPVPPPPAAQPAPPGASAEAPPGLADDRDALQAGERSLLIIEDDREFARLLMELARDKHFKCLVAEDGASGLQLARGYRPNAIVLDLGLPQVDGLTVLERLKDDAQTRHIPIHCVSGSEQGLDARKMGAIGYLLKPVGIDELGDAFKKIEEFLDSSVRNLLLVADTPERQRAVLDLVDSEAVQATLAQDRAQAWQHLHSAQFDCLILDAGAAPDDRLRLLEQLVEEQDLARIPVILYADRELSEGEQALLQRCAEKLVIKSVRSPERLLDEATLFLHQVEARLPEEQQNILHRVHNKEAILAGKKVLVVDDDMRNIYSLAAILEEKGMKAAMAKNGKLALDILAQQDDIDIVLMDIMMPEMDGYETMRRIRAQPKFRELPMIALTAKAMKGDKAKCIEAGANDYLPKPVDTDKLLSLLRVWLYR